MSDVMRPLPFSEALERIAGELKNQKSIFNIDTDQFYSYKNNKKYKIFNQEIVSPLGVAAGPHTQLAQNIVTSYLTGARFIELKTVQILDQLEIEKPCIDARDIGFNIEWSTEFTLEKAYDEYLKAWFLLHILEAAIKNEVIKTPSFIFNASVGYNLDGIKKDKMQKFLSSIKDASSNPAFFDYKNIAIAMVLDGLFDGTEWEESKNNIIETLKFISPNISPSVTVSTMHGCPPKEIEAICSYLIEEKEFDTFVKLNPTLLGYEKVRKILNDLGYLDIQLNRKAFENDLQLSDALNMLKRLKEKADKKNRGFGVKLTNTLGNINTEEYLKGEERYASGRVLMPLSLRVASVILETVKIPVSYSGGVTALVINDLYQTGISPITLATDVLKPGGYLRLTQLASSIDSNNEVYNEIDKAKLEKLIDRVSETDGICSKAFRGKYRAKVNSRLPLFDCFIAPCQEACPIHQMIPDYIALASTGREAEALALIYMDNPLPYITGSICDHECENHCTRLDYEGSVKIREVKKKLAETAFDDFKASFFKKESPVSTKAAVIGAGPAGLSAAYFLVSAGFDTYVFEKEKDFGGVISNIIPSFRIERKALEQDFSLIEEKGAKFTFNSNVKINELRKEGFEYIFVAIGADKSIPIDIDGNIPTSSAISFLAKFKKNEKLSLGKNVIVVGGGNTAMDASRAALRVDGVETVTVLYRRTKDEMPADNIEYEEALKEGVKFEFLTLPESGVDGILKAKVMKLGEKDSTGRRRPIETGKTKEFDASYIISAIGEQVDIEVLKSLGVDSEDKDVMVIGDALTGPSSVVKCIFSAREAVDLAIDRVYEKLENEEDDSEFIEEECHSHEDEHECHCHDHEEDHECHCHEHEEGHECHCHNHESEHEHECHCHEHESEEESEEELREAENLFFKDIRNKKSQIKEKGNYEDSDFFKKEASRCLECNYLCLKCMDVCPNRANVKIDTRWTGVFEDPYQILHLDAYCNECGNCQTFCPHQGMPYKDKFTLFSRLDDFETSSNSGFVLVGNKVKIRLGEEVSIASVDKEGNLSGDYPDEIKAIIETIFLDYSYLLGPVEE